MSVRRRPIGAVLAGGAGQRIGGRKAVVELGGRALISYPLDALRRALDDVAVIAKESSELPALPGVAVWVEPDLPRHPLAGIVYALERAAGRSVVVCAADLPFVTAEMVLGLARTDPGRAPAVVACRGETIQPLLGCYQPPARGPLAAAAAHRLKVTEAVRALDPVLYDVGDERTLFNVNSPEDLLAAAAMLGYPNVKS